jgi:protein-tyrosine phosphatase
MVDIHTHILWDLDDGPSTLEQSLEMLGAAAESGTAGLVATPHWNPRYEYRPALTEERLCGLSDAAAGPMKLYRGCEVHLTWDNVERLLDSPRLYSINGSHYVLVELPNLQVGKHINAVLDHLLNAGLSPILAHPERNPVLQQKLEMLEGWVERGCFIQLTALSVTGGFGGSAQRASMKLMDRGLVHVVASDSHDPIHRHSRLDEAFQKVRTQYGVEYADALFDTNPGDIVNGVRLPEGKQITDDRSGPWWRFWKV